MTLDHRFVDPGDIDLLCQQSPLPATFVPHWNFAPENGAKPALKVLGLKAEVGKPCKMIDAFLEVTSAQEIYARGANTSGLCG